MPMRRGKATNNTFTFSSFVKLLARSSPHEAKLQLLRNIELFAARPDMLSSAIAGVPWDNALALLDGAYYVLPQIEPQSYQEALKLMASARAAEAHSEQVHQHVQLGGGQRGDDDHDDRAVAQQQQHRLSISSTTWKTAIRVLSRLVAAEGEQTPPSAYVNAAHCLVPGRRWEEALKYIAKPADRRGGGVVSKALLLTIAESCTAAPSLSSPSSSSSSSWVTGLKLLSLAEPDFGLALDRLRRRQQQLLEEPHQHDAVGDAVAAANKRRQRLEDARALRIATSLLATAPWHAALQILSSGGNNNKKKTAGSRSRSMMAPAAAFGVKRILESEASSAVLLESWTANPNVPLNVVQFLAQHSRCLSGMMTMPTMMGGDNDHGSDHLLPPPNNGGGGGGGDGNAGECSSTSGKNKTLSSTLATLLDQQQGRLSPVATRLATSLALRSRDTNAVRSLFSRSGLPSAVGRARCSAAILLLARSGDHGGAVSVARRCLSEGVAPLSMEAIRATVSALYSSSMASSSPHHHHGGGCACWYEALGLVSGFVGSATDVSGGGRRTAAAVDTKTMTQLIQLCVFGGAPERALRLVAWAKSEQGTRLQHEGVVTALLFCCKHQRWQEACSLFAHFASSLSKSKNSKRSNRDDGNNTQQPRQHHQQEEDVLRVLFPLVWHVARQSEAQKHAVKLMQLAAPGFMQKK